MHCVERKRMELTDLGDGKGIGGHITLEKLAIPETVKVVLTGRKNIPGMDFIPVSFDCYGHPNFTSEQERLYSFKEEELRRELGDEYTPGAVIEYEEEVFDKLRSKFDSIKGIDRALFNLESLNEVLQDRKRFHKAYPKEPLNPFVIFGRFMLDEYAQVWAIEASVPVMFHPGIDVLDYATFKSDIREVFSLTRDKFVIPPADAVCPCCGKKFQMLDVVFGTCRRIDGKYYHDACWCNYRKLLEIDKFTRQLMSRIYKEADYKFELLSNGYCNEDCCSHIPWFLFHTIDGDIVMGWRKRVISIEWQGNYKPFDMKELFGEEDVTKWEEGEKRGIHAWGAEKAFEYLQKVRETVNPDYRGW